MNASASTPLMQQYQEIKARHRDAILFFRMGDFFEMFYDDAETAARVLGLTLTSRNNGGAATVPLAGVPVKAAGEYLRRLVAQGYRVAICEQVEDPRFAKGIVRREVVETVTPGAAFSDDLLDGARSNYLAAIRVTSQQAAVAVADLSTGEFRVVVSQPDQAAATLERVTPRELLVSDADSRRYVTNGPAPLVTPRADWEFGAEQASRILTEFYGVRGLDGLGFEEPDAAAIGAAGVLIRYLSELQPGGVRHLSRPTIERPGSAMVLDAMTRRNLELVESLRGDDQAGTLLGVLDRTTTPMGARLLRARILAPLVDRPAIESRLDAVGALCAAPVRLAALREALDGVRDIERLAAKAAAQRATPRELRALGDSLARMDAVKSSLSSVAALGELEHVLEGWDPVADVAHEIRRVIVERPPATLGEGETIADGVNAELDELRGIARGGKDAIANLQQAERERTGISSLKVGHNRVFGYYIEVSNANAHLVPAEYQRRQTLAGAERYVTPALKEFEEKVLNATERIDAVERDLFVRVREAAGAAIARLQDAASRIARLDVMASLADVALRESYTRPEIHDGPELVLHAARHPVVERMMPREQFIPNDLTLEPAARLIILTGPNMAGKSTILRQIGLQVLLAHMGSFVPATRATIPIVDRVFTRVGASDNLVRGQSTFMVEMAETSSILHSATARSLVLLDEIGRGTSTWDGVSIAWAVSEHLHDRIGSKTVFATHYHELTQLADELPGVRNMNVAVEERGGDIRFLHRLKPGGADRSYGIEVGRLAGLPDAVLRRARALLAILENEQLAEALARGTSGTSQTREDQLPLFSAAHEHAVIGRLRELDINRLTPLDALAVLAELVADARSEKPLVAPHDRNP